MSLYRSVKIGSLELSGNLFLAPVAGYTDRAFRSLCVEQGASFSFTELISAEALHRSSERYGLTNTTAALTAAATGDFPAKAFAASGSVAAAANLVRKGDNEKHYAIQLFGADPESIYKAAVIITPLRPSAIDINAGCPVPKVVKNGAGSALMKNPSNIGKVVEAAVRASRECHNEVPVTIKMRSGWDSQSINYAECARIAVEAGASMVSLHPRTRAQGYGGKSDWNHLTDMVSRLSVPVTGSGDLYTPEDVQRMLQETGCAAVMFARGAMGNPFIFSQSRSFLETGSWEQASFEVRIEAALRHLEMLALDIGERSACLEMRKQFCSYTKGVQGGAALREKVVHASTIEEYRQIVYPKA
ncbi:MAG: tRNA dihydrouridine synthase DusB [Treponema sp.]|jgi:nifR3 family TIM-barrel protein|nr:tRNA dihydrouridine synthase DusB [Treponema sp.]